MAIDLTPYHIALAQRTITKREVARLEGVSEAYVCRITPKLPESPRRGAKALAQARKAFRTQLAQRVIRGELQLIEAAEQANCSVRTIYRYVSHLKRLADPLWEQGELHVID